MHYAWHHMFGLFDREICSATNSAGNQINSKCVMCFGYIIHVVLYLFFLDYQLWQWVVFLFIHTVWYLYYHIQVLHPAAVHYEHTVYNMAG